MSIPSITTEAGSDGMTLYRIEARHFVAGLEIGHPRHRCAPIVRYMADWTPDAIVAYCRRKGWTITRIDPSWPASVPPTHERSG